MSREEKGSVEQLKGDLYSRTKKASMKGDVRTPLSPSDAVAPRAWVLEEETAEERRKAEEPKRPPIAMLMQKQKHPFSFAEKFLIGSAIFFVLAAGVAAYLFFVGANTISPQNIDMEVLSPSLVDGGKQATLQIVIANRNKGALTLADLIVDYPDGTRSVVTSGELLQHERQTIGTIASGAQVKRTVNAIFYGQQGMQETVTVTLEYSIDGSNAIFQKQAQASFLIGSSPVAVVVQAPSEIISDQNFSMDLTVQASGATPVSDVVVQAQYPAGFSLASSTPEGTAGGTLWRLGTLKQGDVRIIHISGALDGQDGDERVFRFLSGTNSNPTDIKIAVPFLSVPTTLTVRKPFISGTITLNGQSGKTIPVGSGAPITGTIDWKNNLTTSVSNVVLRLSIKGSALDKGSVNVLGGFYQSSDGTITWDSQNTSALAAVPAGGRGTLQFSFATISTGEATVYINPTIDLSLNVSGTRSDQSGAQSTVTSAATAQASVVSLVTLAAQALHATGPISNSGPLPPTVGQNTTYTIQWTVSNSSNSVGNGRVSATLPTYVTYVGGLQNNSIGYDSSSRTVSWTLGEIKAGTGYNNPVRQMAFQVSLSPSSSQVGQVPALTSTATFTGQDRFTQTHVEASALGPTTRLTGEAGFGAGMETVVAR